jgi:phosphate:Na+ symporter
MPLLAILLGLIITVLLQSSSTTIGIVIALAIAGLIDFRIAFFLILGDNIGTCVTAVIASFNGNIASKQLATGHALFNVIGVVIAYLCFPIYQYLIPFLSPGDLTRQIANTHSAFNIINTVIFLPFVTYYIKLIKSIIKGEDYEKKDIQYLDENLIDTPTLALDTVKKEIGVMLDISNEMIVKVQKCLEKFDHKQYQEILVDEDSIDKLENSITQYLIETSRREMLNETSKLAQVLISNVKDVERIGDHGEKMVMIAQKKYEDDVIFSEHAQKDLKKLFSLTVKMLKLSEKAITNDDRKSAKEAQEIKLDINAVISESEKNHINRLKSGQCINIAGHLFSDLLIHFSRINAHLDNIVEAVLE